MDCADPQIAPNIVTATYFSGRRTNRFAAILPGCDVAARRTHRITVICPGAGHIVTVTFSYVQKEEKMCFNLVQKTFICDN